MSEKKFVQGIYKPENAHKYIGKQEIIYRSSWERRFFVFLDRNPKILKWLSEEIVIPYRSIDGKTHRYFPDIYIKTNSGQEFILEIKPYNKTIPPKRKGNILNDMEYLRNRLKWEACEKYCKNNNYKFQVLTENHINPMFSDRKIYENLEKLKIL
jgi:hypothetical protein